MAWLCNGPWNTSRTDMVDVMLPSQVLLFLLSFLKLWRLSNWSWHHICSCLILFRFVKDRKSPWFDIQKKVVLFFSGWRFFRSDSTRILFPTNPNMSFWCGTYLAFSMESMLSGPVLHRHPTSPLLVTHVDSIELTLIKCIYIYLYR